MADIRPDRRTLTSGSRRQGFQDLSPYRVHDILLVSALYDSFILAEDGRLGEVILNEFLRLDLRQTPGLTRVSTGAEALDVARREGRHNLIITSLHVGDMSAGELARAVARGRAVDAGHRARLRRAGGGARLGGRGRAASTASSCGRATRASCSPS